MKFDNIPKNIVLNKEFNYYEVSRKILDEAKIDSFYEESFYQDEKIDYLQKAWGEDKDWYMLQWNLRLEYFVKNYSKHKKAKILDIGTGPEHF